MKHFNFKRFALVLRRDLCEGRRKYLMQTLALLFVMVAIVIMRRLSQATPLDVDACIDVDARLIGTIGFPTLYALAFIFSLSLTFSNFRNRRRRLAELMLPATNLEKFLVRIVVSVVVFTLAFFLAVVAVDALRLALYALNGWEVASVSAYFFPEMWRGLIRGMTIREWTDVADVGMTLCTLSIILLGSALFRRYALVKTFAVCFTLMLLLLFVLKAMPVLTEIPYDVYRALLCSSWLFALLFVWLSYRIFKRIPVIPRKRFGL